MRRKNGFTLIELLAVIVILAIIALIATPIILGVIEKARIGAAQSSAYGYIDAVEKQIAINILDETKENIVDGVYQVTDLTSKGVTIKGNPPTGNVTIKDGRVVNYTLVIDDKYTITPTSTSDSGSSDVAKVCKIADGSTTIDVGTEVDCAGEHFYVYDTTSDNYKMLSKYNLKVGGVVYARDYTAYTEDEMTYLQDENMKGFVSDQTENYGTTAFSSDNQKGINYSDYEGSIVEGYVNGYKIKLKELGVSVVDVTLITKDELVILGLKDFNEYIEEEGVVTAPDWLYSTTYWSSSTSDTDMVWGISSLGWYGDNYTGSDIFFGVRPVIVISKDVLK